MTVSLIKTKLKGNTRNLIGEESTIKDIINKLKLTVKGESVEVLSAKIMNTRQNNKTANTYCSEIENLTKSLKNAYISDGLSCELASKYATQDAVKALAKNCTIDRVKLIMEAGQFNNMNEAITKFVNSCQKQLASKMLCCIWVENIIHLITKEIIINIEENIIILIIKTLLTTSDLYKD